jgi:hypothetical protein
MFSTIFAQDQFFQRAVVATNGCKSSWYLVKANQVMAQQMIETIEHHEKD